jgi:multisubunit Na+/H+ antiporter MnhE subunit
MARRKRERPGGLFDRPAQLLTVTGVLLAISWICFVGSVHLHEMIVGAVVVALCTAFCALIYSSATLPLDFHLRDVLQIWRVPQAIFSDAVVVTVALLRDLSGGRPVGSLYRVCGFGTSTRDPILVGRGALATMYTTMSPNTIVIGIDASQSHLLFHQVERAPVPELIRQLGPGR